MIAHRNIESGHNPIEGQHIDEKSQPIDPKMIAYFHDQKSPEFFEFEDSSESFGQWLEKHQSTEVREDEEKEVKILQETIDKINQARLEDEYSDDEVQKVLLEQKKVEAIKLIDDIGNKIQEYLNRVSLNLRAQKSSKEADNYAVVLLETDKNRTRAHNALLDALRIAIRNISHNFAIIDSVALEKWEDHLDKHGQDVLRVERQEFVPKIICPENVDVNDRNSVAQWANKLHHAFSKLEEKNK